MRCPKCFNENNVRNGFVQGKQRWKCRRCGRSFTISYDRGVDWEIKKCAFQLYLEGVSIRSIADILGVSNVAVGKWFDRPEEIFMSLRRRSEKKYREEEALFTSRNLNEITDRMYKSTGKYDHWMVFRSTIPSFYGNVLFLDAEKAKEIENF